MKDFYYLLGLVVALPLLLGSVVRAEVTPQQLCLEIQVEVAEAVREGIINEQEAAAFLDGCIDWSQQA